MANFVQLWGPLIMDPLCTWFQNHEWAHEKYDSLRADQLVFSIVSTTIGILSDKLRDLRIKECYLQVLNVYLTKTCLHSLDCTPLVPFILPVHPSSLNAEECRTISHKCKLISMPLLMNRTIIHSVQCGKQGGNSL